MVKSPLSGCNFEIILNLSRAQGPAATQGRAVAPKERKQKDADAGSAAAILDCAIANPSRINEGLRAE
jgi:hypothetical protein